MLMMRKSSRKKSPSMLTEKTKSRMPLKRRTKPKTLLQALNSRPKMTKHAEMQSRHHSCSYISSLKGAMQGVSLMLSTSRSSTGEMQQASPSLTTLS